MHCRHFASRQINGFMKRPMLAYAVVKSTHFLRRFQFPCKSRVKPPESTWPCGSAPERLSFHVVAVLLRVPPRSCACLLPFLGLASRASRVPFLLPGCCCFPGEPSPLPISHLPMSCLLAVTPGLPSSFSASVRRTGRAGREGAVDGEGLYTVVWEGSLELRWAALSSVIRLSQTDTSNHPEALFSSKPPSRTHLQPTHHLSTGSADTARQSSPRRLLRAACPLKGTAAGWVHCWVAAAVGATTRGRRADSPPPRPRHHTKAAAWIAV